MSIWHVNGGERLQGAVRVQGSKNAVLPVIAAALLCENETELTNCPHLSDVDAAVDILRYLGCGAQLAGDTLHLDTSQPVRCDIPRELMHRMRSSVIFLGPLLARFGEARVSLPGGCELGPRPIDLHLQALRLLGAEIREEADGICCQTRGLRGAEIPLALPSVGATENAMIAACAAEGDSIIYNAAREPEIETLQEYLRLLGANISGAGSPVIRVRGFSRRTRAGLRVPPDRIVAATYLCCAASAGGMMDVLGANPAHLQPVLQSLQEMGCVLSVTADRIHISAPGRCKAPRAVVTRPYPAFPTDAAPLLMAACLRAEGTSVFIENIFSGRYRHAEEMTKFGADVVIRGPLAMVTGVEELHGSELTSPDLRGGAALVTAALGAAGHTVIRDNGHIQRGYEGLDSVLRGLGADIWREEPPAAHKGELNHGFGIQSPDHR